MNLSWQFISIGINRIPAGSLRARQHGIVYLNAISTTTLVAMLYVTETCGALFFSGFRGLVLLGSVNLGGVLVVMPIRRYAFTSIMVRLCRAGQHYGDTCDRELLQGTITAEPADVSAFIPIMA